MRLIDADAYEFPGDLINEPTINPDDLRPHGRWIQISKARYYEESDRYICSICGSIDENGEQDFEVTTPPYCEYCGAKMDGIDRWCNAKKAEERDRVKHDVKRGEGNDNP